MKVIYIYTAASYLTKDLFKEAITEQTDEIDEIVQEDPDKVKKTPSTLKFIWSQRVRIAPLKSRADAHRNLWFPLGMNIHVKKGYGGLERSFGSIWTSIPGVKDESDALIASFSWKKETLWRLEELGKEHYA